MELEPPKCGIAVVFCSCMRFDRVMFVRFIPSGRMEVTLFEGNTLLAGGGSLTNLFFISSVIFQNASTTGCLMLSVALFTVLLTTFTKGSTNLFG